MKFIEKLGPKEGDLRARRGFLFLPKTIGRETRWLERAYWTEAYGPDYGRGRSAHHHWHATSWRQVP